MSDPWSGWEFLTKHSESLRNLALTGVSIIAGTVGTFLAIRRTTAANRSSWAANEQAKTGVQSHITENFTKAIEQLGSDKLDVRLGAIYALARIAQDSERDYWPIMQTLTAYVRERRPRLPDTQSSETEKSLIVDIRGAPFSIQPNTHSEIDITPPKLPADIQSVLTVLGSRKHEYEKPHQALDLSNTDLRQLVLRPGENHLGRIILTHTDLRGSYLNDADLRGSYLNDADLRGVKLSGADLSGAKLYDADLSGDNTDLRSAILCGADLNDAKLRKANLRGVNFCGAHLNRVKFSGTDLLNADFCGADLFGANLIGAKNLTCEQLTRANDWKSAFRDSTLACGADIPQAAK